MIANDEKTKQVELVSLKTLARLWDMDRTTARRCLREAGIEPIIVGRGRNGSIRFIRREVEQWLDRQPRAG